MTASILYSARPTTHSTRLLTIYGGAGAAEVRCGLETVELDNSPPYEALSYVWGDANMSEEIICDDTVITVTPNLVEALRRIRQADRTRVVWTNAILEFPLKCKVQLRARRFRIQNRKNTLLIKFN